MRINDTARYVAGRRAAARAAYKAAIALAVGVCEAYARDDDGANGAAGVEVAEELAARIGALARPDK